jgi:enoyl-CoA hydratase/carnithine racemase
MLKTARNGAVAEIHMDRPPANALNTELVGAVLAAHASACASDARAIVLTGRPGIFSGGLDVPGLLPLDRARMHEFWHAFFRLNLALAGGALPVVAAISGHSPAGGAVLAIHCDYRVATAGRFRMGFNEVAVGLPVPPSILTAMAMVVGQRTAHRLATTAELIPMEQALQWGLVDELVEPEMLLNRAHEIAETLAALPPRALRETRTMCRGPLLAVLDPERQAELATDYWFSAETQAGMRALVERLQRKP